MVQNLIHHPERRHRNCENPVPPKALAQILDAGKEKRTKKQGHCRNAKKKNPKTARVGGSGKRRSQGGRCSNLSHLKRQICINGAQDNWHTSVKKTH